VSRGGIKLAHGLDHFGWEVAGAVAMDVGSSTGGFTDVLLQRGATRVYAVDSGTNQLAWKLRQDPRVAVLEQTSARILTAEHIPEPVNLIVCDASFIGLAKVLDRPLGFARAPARLMALVKPQFEAGAPRSARAGWCETQLSGSGSARRSQPGSPTVAGASRASRKVPSRDPRGMWNTCSPPHSVDRTRAVGQEQDGEPRGECVGGIASKGQLRWAFWRWAIVTVPLVLLLGFWSGNLAPSGNENAWYAALAKPALTPPAGCSR
jgi:23S rRNA (cytidine1920-2'-O)/16S rRNA (cytidine1409-2'-O)-methyltransferase